MSGQQHVTILSEHYKLTITGGISSWDYEGMREKDHKLNNALLALKPALDSAFAAVVDDRQLKPLIGSYDGKAKYIHGVVIEANPEKDADNRRHFKQYRNSSKNGLFLADHEQHIANTSFKVIIGVVVTDRIKREDLETILHRQRMVIQESTPVMEMLY